MKELTNLVKDVRENSSDNSYLELKSEVQDCYYSVYHRYKYKLYQSGVSRQDSFDDIDIVLLKSINTFDENRNVKFSTHFTNYSFYHFKRLLSSKYCHQNRFTYPLDYDDYDSLNSKEFCNDDDNPERLLELSDLKKRIREILEEGVLTDNERSCILEKYFSGDTVKSDLDTSIKLGIGRNQVSNLIKNGSKKIKKRLKFEEKVENL